MRRSWWFAMLVSGCVVDVEAEDPRQAVFDDASLDAGEMFDVGTSVATESSGGMDTGGDEEPSDGKVFAQSCKDHTDAREPGCAVGYEDNACGKELTREWDTCRDGDELKELYCTHFIYDDKIAPLDTCMKDGYELDAYVFVSCDALCKRKKFTSGSCKTKDVTGCLGADHKDVGYCECV